MVPSGSVYARYSIVAPLISMRPHKDPVSDVA